MDAPGAGKECSRVVVAREQPVLGDITNRYHKKGVPLVPGKFLIANDTIRKRECMRGGIEDHGSKKRVLGELENISKGKCAVGIRGNVVDNRKGLPLSEGSDDGCSKRSFSPKARKTCESAILDCNAEPAEVNLNLDISNWTGGMERILDSLDRRHIKVGNSQRHAPGEAELRDSWTSSMSSPLRLERVRDPLLVAGKTNQVYSQKSSEETSNILQTEFVAMRKCNQRYSQKSSGGMSNILQNDAVAARKCKLELEKSSIPRNASIEFANLVDNVSQGSNSLPTERFDGNSEHVKSGATVLLGPSSANIEEPEGAQTLPEHVPNVEEDMVLGKACSCSFCLKAAYLWTDILYQDFKGRLSEINRSRRDARFLAGRSFAHDSIRSTGGNKRKILALESELTQHWRNLFLHTENVLMCESARLQSNVLKLKEVRENCKRDVDTISKVPSSEA
ncbi:hypothetical protein Taro_046742 [Colocasia esculenta]|uniref:Uncharacterized protein n=1 Tax=Colocasia esculenta TaxID=4460 RepID=A0A843WZQ9_COLES|nr:hypothetical protein [Colocasia esculenta]